MVVGKKNPGLKNASKLNIPVGPEHVISWYPEMGKLNNSLYFLLHLINDLIVVSENESSG